jgi:ribosomal protein S18 acetylase RimI-like enzyme
MINYLELSISDLNNELIAFHSKNKNLIFNNIYSSNFLEKEVFFSTHDKSLVFLIKDQQYDFYKVYFATANLDSLKILLNSIHNKNCILEFITKDLDNYQLFEIFEQARFNQYAILKKMSLLSIKQLELTLHTQSNVKTANSIHSDIIHEIFNKQFDKFIDRIPTKKIINMAIKDELILVAFENDVISGFLWFDFKKVISEIRYLYVCPEFRGIGISSNLLNEYHKKVSIVKKKQLWVLSNNNIALNLYNKFGYKFDALSDIIFCRIQ